MGEVVGASFRDPAGFVVREEGIFKRIVTQAGKADYEAFMASGLYERLCKKGWLIAHRESALSEDGGHKKLEPEQIPVISYPYEWTFSQLQDAARLTLNIQSEAIACGFSLKDATPFNVQFVGCQPVFIDTLSFEPLPESPWVAYKQFCELFLAPLALAAYRGSLANRYLQVDLHGLDLSLCSALLPWRTFLRPHLLMHLHLHARSQRKHQDKRQSPASGKAPRSTPQTKLAIVESLKSAVEGLHPQEEKTAWLNYYQDEENNYAPQAEAFKLEFVGRWVEKIRPQQVLDLGCNTGKFSRLASSRGIRTIAADQDTACLEVIYQRGRKEMDRSLLPLRLDLTNPAPGLGWENQERLPVLERVTSDLTLALALLHHLAIGNNVPLERLAAFFSAHANHLIIEFVPKEDSMVQLLLKQRKDIFPHYTLEAFEAAMGRHFRIEERTAIPGSQRFLYALSKLNG